MPFWCIYHSPSIFKDDTTKKPLADALTKMYQQALGFPAFYVVVVFQATDIYVGGEVRDAPFVRIVADQIAVKMPDDVKGYNAWTSIVDKTLAPHIADKGYDYEYHIGETPRWLWKVQGMNAPPWGSEEMNKWAVANKALPREVADEEEDGEEEKRRMISLG